MEPLLTRRLSFGRSKLRRHRGNLREEEEAEESAQGRGGVGRNANGRQHRG